MATLRDPLFRQSGLTAEDFDSTESMGSLRRSWEATRIGTELNPLRTKALDAKIAGDVAGEAAARTRIRSLETEQARYAPRIGRVEDINGVGDALSWAGSLVGQGAASMLDPVAASASLAAAGRGLRAIPTAPTRALGMAAQGASVAVPYMMGKSQLTGEFIGSAEQDKALMARTSAQQLRDTAGVYGGTAAIADTMFPALVGRQLAGAGLRAGLSKTGVLPRTALAMIGEGSTETAQNAGSQFALGQLNPERDTSGDNSELLNSFVGGAVGAGPFAYAGAAADSGYRRIGDTTERIGTAAGQAFDLAADTARPLIDQAREQGGEMLGKAKEQGSELFGRGAAKVIDLATDDQGNASATAFRDNLRDMAGLKPSMTDEERQIVTFMPPEDIAVDEAASMTWLTANAPKRAGVIKQKLEALGEDNDAFAMIDAIDQAQTADEQQAAMDNAAKFLVDNEPTRADERAIKASEVFGQLAGKAGSFAVDAAKSMWKGASDGFSKKNAQTGQTPNEDFLTWRDNYYGTSQKPAEQALNEGASYVRAQNFNQRAQLAGDYAADMAVRRKLRNPNVKFLARHVAYALADMSESWGTPNAATVARQGLAGREAKLNRLTNDVRLTFKDEAPQVLAQIGSILGPDAAPALKYMQAELTKQSTPGWAQQEKAERSALTAQMTELIGVDKRTALMKDGINVHSPEQGEHLLKVMEDFADGIGGSPGMRAALDANFGKESVDAILGLLNGRAAEKEALRPGAAVEDRGQIAEENFDPNADDEMADGPDAFEMRQAEKVVGRGVAAPVYAFGGGLGLRSEGNPFVPTEKTTAKGRAERALSGEAPVKRPTLLVEGERAFNPVSKAYDGEDLINLRKRQMGEELGASNEYDIKGQSAAEVMKSLKMQPGSILAAYRDYLRMDAENTSGRYTRMPEQVAEMKRKADRMNKVMSRVIAISKGAEPPRSTPNERKQRRLLQEEMVENGVEGMSVDQYEYDQLLKEANDYFSERYVVTATQMMNEVPEQITFAEFDQMKKMGKRVEDVVRKNAGDDDTLYDQLMAEANLVVFPTVDKKGEPSEVAIPAGKLVEWVKRTRGKYESDAKTEEKFSDFAKNKQYREAVMAGVSAMVSSPFVTGMPYKLNAGGEQESFADGIPPSLQLATALEAKDRADYATFKAKLAAEEGPSRAGFVDNKGDEYQDKVAADQERNEEFFTPEDRAIRELEVGDTRGVRSKRRSRKDDTRAAAEANDAGGELVTRGTGRGIGLPIRVDISGSVEAEPKTDYPHATEMDFFRDQKPGEVPDDFADQQFHTKQTMGAFALPKSKMAAFRGAKRTAEELTALMGSNPQRAREVIMAHLRTAMQGEAYNSSGVVGDAYHIAPIINMLDKGKNPKNPDAKSNFERLQAAGAPPNLIDGMERAALTVLIRAADGRNELSDAHLKSLYMTLEGVNDNLKQMQAKLAKRGVIDLNKLGAYVSPKRPAAPVVDVSTKPLGQNPSRATEKVDEDNAPSGSTSFKRTPNKVVGAPGEASRTVSQEFVDRQTAKVTAGKVPKAAPKEGAADFGRSLDANREQQLGEGFDSPESPLLNGPQDLADREAKYQRKNAASGVAKSVPPKPSGAGKPREAPKTAPGLLAKTEGTTADPIIGDIWDQDGRAPGGLLTNPPTAPTAHQAKETAKLAGADLVLAPITPPGYAGDLGRAAQAEGKLLVKVSPDVAGKTVLVSVPGKGRGFTAMPTLIAKVIRTLENGATVRTDNQANAERDWNKDGEGALRAALIAGGYVETSGKDFSSWSKNETAPTRKLNAQSGEQSHTSHVDELKQGGAYTGWQTGPTAGPSLVATQAEMDEATDYVKKVLGPKIRVEFKNITGYSGEFIDATNTIVISTTAAAGTMGTIYHEALHVFFRDFVKGNPELLTIFKNLVDNEKHMERLNALLDGYPAAKAQLVSGEERLAYTYQFWKAGLIQVDAKATTILQKIGKFFRRVFGMVRDSEKALALFTAFDQGKMSEPNAAAQVIAKALGNTGGFMKLRRSTDALVQGVAALAMPAAEVLLHSTSAKARKLSAVMFTNPGDGEHGGMRPGLLNARREASRKFTNRAHKLIAGLSEMDHQTVMELMQKATPLDQIKVSDHRVAVEGLRKVFEEFHDYLTGSGLELGKVDNYFPVVWNVDALLDKKAAFLTMLETKYAAELKPLDGNIKKAAQRVWQSLVDRDGVDAHLPASREDGVLSPFFASQERRTLPWLKPEDRAQFLDKNLNLTLTRYFSQGAHAAEYRRRFGEHGTKLDDILYGTKAVDSDGYPLKVNGEIVRSKDGITHELMTTGQTMLKNGRIKDAEGLKKWHRRQMRDISHSVGAMEGVLGKDVSDTMRKYNSWMTVYQNVRLLPMSLFSSFVDPLAMVARGAPMSAAYESFVYGMREVFRTWGDAFRDMPPERAKDEWRELSEMIGSSEVAMFSSYVADEYASVYMSEGAKKINDKMFVFNGMEAWNRGSRIMATKWATRFLEKHSALPDKNHSARWLAELGLKPSDIALDDGKLVTNAEHLAALKGISLDKAKQEMALIHTALNRWVEGAVLTPNAGQRPAWSSDPHFATVFHLKQFAYSFHQTVLKRAVNEFKYGNIAPVGVLAMFIPTMIASDVMKGLIQGGGELPAYMAGMNAGDWFLHGAQRAGLLGVGTIGTDAGTDIASVGGPAVEQVVDAMRDGFGEKTFVKSLPVNALYGQAILQ